MVSGRSRSGSIPTGAKPIPGTTLTLTPSPSLPGSSSSRSQSLSGPAYPPLPAHAGELPLDGDAQHDGAGDAGEDKAAAKVQFFLEEASSVGSRTSAESGYSGNNTGSYAEACKKLAAAAGTGDSTRPGSGVGGHQAASGAGKAAEAPGGGGGAGRSSGSGSGSRGEERWSRDRDYATRKDYRQDGRYASRGRGLYNQGGRGRGGDYDNNNRRGHYDNYRGGGYYGEGRGFWNRRGGGGHYHQDQQYGRPGGRQSRSEPQFSGQEPLRDNRNLRRAVSDRPPDTQRT